MAKYWLIIGLAVLPFNMAIAEPLIAGRARIDITPPLEFKTSLGGYGDRMSEPAVGVHDRLFAKALVIVQREKKYALVTADALGFPPAFKPAMIEKIDDPSWSAENIMLLPSHSHTTFDMSEINPMNELGIPQLGIYRPELFEVLIDRFATLIKEAEKTWVPIKVGTDSIQVEGWAANRRRGETFKDEVLTVTRLDTEEGMPFAIFVNFAAHPTFMSEREMMFSGGWPGQMQRTVEALVGEDALCLFSNGAEGDQRPVARPDSGSSNWEKAERYGREFAIEVHQVWENIKPQPIQKFAYHLEVIDLPPRSWHPDFMQTGGAEYGLREDMMDVLIEGLVPAKSMCGFLRLDDLLLIGIPGELAAGIGKELKDKAIAKTGIKHAIIGGLANEWISYMLSPEQYNGTGGYEASVSFYGPQLGPMVVEGALGGVEKVR